MIIIYFPNCCKQDETVSTVKCSYFSLLLMMIFIVDNFSSKCGGQWSILLAPKFLPLATKLLVFAFLICRAELKRWCGKSAELGQVTLRDMEMF